MKPTKIPASEVQTLKVKRDELFRQFEDRPWQLSLAAEIKSVDDRIAELSGGSKKAGTEQTRLVDTVQNVSKSRSGGR